MPIDFIPASLLKERYQVWGHFYNFSLSKKSYPCRSRLEIVAQNTGLLPDNPDAIVIMMNPGSSRPVKADYLPHTYDTYPIDLFEDPALTLTKPDNAQYQIMRLMEIQGWRQVRILNLSDLQNGNSTTFKQTLQKLIKRRNCFSHSITHQERSAELERLLMSQTDIIIAAWGDMKTLEPYAENIAHRYPIIGLQKGQSTAYKFASPMLHKHKLEWLAEISSLLKKQNE